MADRPLQEIHETFQLPVYYGTRAEGDLGGYGTVTISKESSCLNMIPGIQRNYITGSSEIVATKRQGIMSQQELLTDLEGGSISGDWTIRDVKVLNSIPGITVFAYYKNVAGTKTIEIKALHGGASTWVSVGTISNVAGPPAVVVDELTEVYLSEIEIGGVPGIAVVISSFDTTGLEQYTTGSSAAYYALTASKVFTAASLTKISDADFPTNQTPYVHIVGPLIQMNQINYVLGRNGKIFNSNTDTIGTWSALGFLDAQSYPDAGIALCRYKHHIVLFNEKSVEFFDDVGNDPTLGSPLQRTDQAFIKFGCVHPKAVLNLEDNLYWISISETSNLDVYKLDGYTPVAFSTNEIREYLTKTYFETNLWNGCFLIQSTSFCGKNCLFISLSTNIANDTLSNLIGGLSYSDVSEIQWNQNYDVNVKGLIFNLNDNLWSLFNLNFQDDSLQTKEYTLYFWQRDNFSGCAISTLNSADTFSAHNLMFGYHSLSMSSVSYQDYDYGIPGEYPISTIITTPILDFGTENRKIIHRFKANYGAMTGAVANPSHEYLRLIVNKNLTSYFTNRWIRTLNVHSDNQIGERFYGNNIGTARQFQFGVFYKGSSDLSLRSLELSVTRNIH